MKKQIIFILFALTSLNYGLKSSEFCKRVMPKEICRSQHTRCEKIKCRGIYPIQFGKAYCSVEKNSCNELTSKNYVIHSLTNPSFYQTLLLKRKYLLKSIKNCPQSPRYLTREQPKNSAKL